MKLSAPIYIHWEITDACNLKCRHCYQQRPNSVSGVDSNNLMKVAEQLVKEKIFQVTLTGGEPLLVPELLDLIIFLSKNKIRPRITTNGFLINQMAIDIFRDYNVKVQVSLDSSDEIEHNYIRNNDSAYSKAIEALNLLVKNKCDVSIGFCANRLNYYRIEDVIRLALKLGVNSLLVGEMVPNNENNSSLYFTKEEYSMFITEVSKLKKRYERELQLSIDTEWGFLLNSDLEHAPCSALDRDMTILANGDVVPCPFIRHKNYVIGNINRESINKIWNSEKAEYFRTNKYVGCDNKCNNFEICKSGCKAILANKGKAIEGVDCNAPCIKWELI